MKRKWDPTFKDFNPLTSQGNDFKKDFYNNYDEPEFGNRNKLFGACMQIKSKENEK